MKYEISWLTQASEELANIRSYIEQDNPSTAQKLIAQILKHVKKLEEMPYLGQLDDVVPELRFIVVKPNYSIYYQVDEEKQTVFIAHVWHSARDKRSL